MKKLLLLVASIFVPVSAYAGCTQVKRQLAVFLGGSPEVGPATHFVLFDEPYSAAVACPFVGIPDGFSSYVVIPKQRVCDGHYLTGVSQNDAKTKLRCQVGVLYKMKGF